MEAETSTWKSIRGTRRNWSEHEVIEASRLLLECLPKETRTFLATDAWQGGPIVTVSDPILWRIKLVDLKKNKIILKAMLTLYADTIPSAFFFADVFLAADAACNGRLLLNIPTPGAKLVQKQEMALKEGGKLKKCIQHLRLLWRDNGHRCASPDPDIAELKTLLRRAPTRSESGMSVSMSVLG